MKQLQSRTKIKLKVNINLFPALKLIFFVFILFYKLHFYSAESTQAKF